jgi:uncharacterized repeat protein (TIGR01451 family)
MSPHRFSRPLICLGAAALALLAARPARAIGTPPGTVISNQARADYTDTNGTALAALSNTVTTTVSAKGGVLVNPDHSATATHQDTVTYAHTVTNNGNTADTIDMTAVSSNGWTVALYRDVNTNGLYDAGTDTLLADTDGDSAVDTGALAPDTTLDILVRITVPAGAGVPPASLDGTVDTLTVTGTSSVDTLVTESAVDTTTVSAPNLSLAKSVSPAGNQPPGTTLTYTIIVSNVGTRLASTVVLTDNIPANTTYVPGSIVQDGGGKSDAADGDNADFNGTRVRVNVGSLAAGGGATTITFRVVIN